MIFVATNLQAKEFFLNKILSPPLPPPQEGNWYQSEGHAFEAGIHVSKRHHLMR